jgi:hypothetical protein
MAPEPEPAGPNERLRARREQARRRRRRHRNTALAVLIVAAALVALGATVIGTRGSHGAASKSANTEQKAKPKSPRPMPDEVRGVHVTMGLASLSGKFEQYLAIPGLNTIELDVKDENGKVGFLLPAQSLARKVGAAQPYYK